MTPKQQRFVEEYLIRRYAALRLIARHVGMLPLTDEKAQKHREALGEAPITLALLVLASDAPRWARQWAMLTLDLISADWRDVAGPEIMGPNIDRNDPLVRKWRLAVLANDNGKCRHCGATENLHAHHVIRWADDPSQRLNTENGIALCKVCHEEEHRRYG